MSDVTPTNEESLIAALRNLSPGHYLLLEPSRGSSSLPGTWIEVYEVPIGAHFEYLPQSEKARRHICSLLGLALHSDVWQIRGDASKYR